MAFLSPPAPPAAPPLGALGTTHLSLGKSGSTKRSLKVLAGIQVSKQGSEKSLESHLGYPAGGAGDEVVEDEVVEEELLELEEDVVTTFLCLNLCLIWDFLCLSLYLSLLFLE